MSKIMVTGGTPLVGEIQVKGAKNAALPILAATLLAKEPVYLYGCPRLSDVENMIALMRSLGCSIRWEEDVLFVDTRSAQQHEMPDHLLKAIRSSIFLLGPMVARFQKATAKFPGGCEIGLRPIDLHIAALKMLGVTINEEKGTLYCSSKGLHGAQIHLDYPSVGATENAMMAAVAAKGDTEIHNAAREPEIIDLQGFLNSLGYRVDGAGTSSIHIVGGRVAGGAKYHIMPDRIVAGTYLCAAALTRGDVAVKGVEAEYLVSVLHKLRECGCKVMTGERYIRVQGPDRPKEIKRLETSPYPGFPTDMQAQMFAVCTAAEGTSMIVENVFENRFKHAAELARMGAECSVSDRTAVIRGVERLYGTDVSAWDLRGGAALILAGLRAQGETIVSNPAYIDRGYESIERDLVSLGADVRRINEE
ncbi:UDP-N-acetylglucosamine 1-carboxyvinyltransferase [Christensenellaceae bacterium OttesenSCG-928-M15]|nr:UDP-N-acetylglucosamine 1-carboxyvinyltransferase [Christensenellaceae bacterium OttesenSCG-928-M15]